MPESTFPALNPIYVIASYGHTMMVDILDRCKNEKAANARIACLVVFSPHGLLC